MALSKFRWSKVYESSEEELLDFLQARRIQAERQEVEASDTQTLQAIAETTIWCAEGSLTVNDGTITSLQPGDALRLAPETAAELQAGLTGYTCYISR